MEPLLGTLSKDNKYMKLRSVRCRAQRSTNRGERWGSEGSGEIGVISSVSCHKVQGKLIIFIIVASVSILFVLDGSVVSTVWSFVLSV